MLRVGVVGSGYVGLVTGACLAELGHSVVCVDVDADKISRLQAGRIPIYEPGLEDLVTGNVRAGRLQFDTNIAAVAASGGVDVFFIAVGTPTASSDGGVNLDYVYSAADDVGRALAKIKPAFERLTAVVTKSTVPLGTSWKVERIIARHVPSHRFAVASNPEFMREGSAIEDFMQPDRIVIGSHSEEARKLLEDLYSPLIHSGRPLVVTPLVETAELIKYAANAFLATKVTFINELACLCEASGADIQQLALGVGLDKRIGTHFFSAGPGFGGSCFPKDLRALTKTGNDFGSPVEIVETVIRANERHKQLMVRKIRSALGGRLEGRRIGVLGLAFKANTDDMRDAPALTILPPLIADGAEIVAYDPVAEANAKVLLPDVTFAESIQATIASADAVVILTEWNAFRAIEWSLLLPTMRSRVVVDLRNLYEPDSMLQLGVDYISVGRAVPQRALEAAAE